MKYEINEEFIEDLIERIKAFKEYYRECFNTRSKAIDRIKYSQEVINLETQLLAPAAEAYKVAAANYAAKSEECRIKTAKLIDQDLEYATINLTVDTLSDYADLLRAELPKDED